MKTCVIVGQNMPDATSDALVAEHDRTIIFEPLPDAAKACGDRYCGQPQVVIFQNACGEQDNFEHRLNIYNTNGASSSLGTISTSARNLYQDTNLALSEAIPVAVVNLHKWLSPSIDHITTLKCP